MIRDEIRDICKTDFNHVLIQFYRSGLDYIKEHADKSLDVSVDSPIVNFSLGNTNLKLCIHIYL
jgi:alkylated DNA repair dioxygenase AlkB